MLSDVQTQSSGERTRFARAAPRYSAPEELRLLRLNTAATDVDRYVFVPSAYNRFVFFLLDNLAFNAGNPLIRSLLLVILLFSLLLQFLLIISSN